MKSKRYLDKMKRASSRYQGYDENEVSTVENNTHDLVVFIEPPLYSHCETNKTSIS